VWVCVCVCVCVFGRHNVNEFVYKSRRCRRSTRQSARKCRTERRTRFFFFAFCVFRLLSRLRGLTNLFSFVSFSAKAQIGTQVRIQRTFPATFVYSFERSFDVCEGSFGRSQRSCARRRRQEEHRADWVRAAFVVISHSLIRSIVNGLALPLCFPWTMRLLCGAKQ
jgi:hypothetical protein